MLMVLLVPIVLLMASHVGLAGPSSPAPADSVTATEPVPSPVEAELAPFEVQFGELRVPYPVFAAFVLPEQVVEVAIDSANTLAEVEWGGGSSDSVGPNRWLWRAPEKPGVYPIRFTRPEDRHVATLNVFVMVPYGEMRSGRLRTYDIGHYPRSWERGGDAYTRPGGFVEVTEANDTTRVAPHFRLGQFACKAGSGYPKYLVLQPTLLTKLELLLEAAKRRGVRASTFHVMSAYRTPLYNRGIGNTTSFSRHQYGDAADIFVDESPLDGRMDDLNQDGRFDKADAMVLRELADEADHTSGLESLVGGLSAYGANAAHGPFLHVDARGRAARW